MSVLKSSLLGRRLPFLAVKEDGYDGFWHKNFLKKKKIGFQSGPGLDLDSETTWIRNSGGTKLRYILAAVIFFSTGSRWMFFNLNPKYMSFKSSPELWSSYGGCMWGQSRKVFSSKTSFSLKSILPKLSSKLENVRYGSWCFFIFLALKLSWVFYRPFCWNCLIYSACTTCHCYVEGEGYWEK